MYFSPSHSEITSLWKKELTEITQSTVIVSHTIPIHYENA